ncbi:MAG: glycosyltransferase family 4 protein [Acidimicrobiales bacterium]
MRVAVDGRRLQDRPLTGAGRWLANLVPLLAAEADVVVLTDARRPPPSLEVDQAPLAVAPRLPEVFWLQWSAARWLAAQDRPAGPRPPGGGASTGPVFHGAFNALPRRWRGPSVVTIFDLSFEHHPEDFSAAKRRLFRGQARWAAGHAGVVVTVSAHARRAILETYGTDPDGVVVAPPAVDPVFTDLERVAGQRERAAAMLAARGVTGPYVVAVGGARRRGLEVAVAAWRRLGPHGRHLALVVVGSQSPGAGPGLVHLGPVDDPTWAGVLAGARALCYPTRFEGYGMPAMEAAACGVPVVCGPVGPLPEVLGDAAEWCDQADPRSVGSALARVLGDAARHQELDRLGRDRAAAGPTWEASAAVVAGAYRRAAAEGGW